MLFTGVWRSELNDIQGVSENMQQLLTSTQVRFKANMNSYIQLQTATIFFLSSLYLKQGIDSVYVMVGFICKGLLEV